MYHISMLKAYRERERERVEMINMVKELTKVSDESKDDKKFYQDIEVG